MKFRFFNALIDLLFDALSWLMRVKDDDCTAPALTSPDHAEAASQTISIEGSHV
jgi:hypothetical protein